MLLVTLGATLLKNILASKGVRVTSQRRGAIIAGDGIIQTGRSPIRAKQDFWRYLILSIVFKYKDIIKMIANFMAIFEK